MLAASRHTETNGRYGKLAAGSITPIRIIVDCRRITCETLRRRFLVGSGEWGVVPAPPKGSREWGVGSGIGLDDHRQSGGSAICRSHRLR